MLNSRNDAFDNAFEVYIPVFPRVDPDSLQYINNKITSCDVPGIKMDTFNDGYLTDTMAFAQREDNKGLFQFSMELKVDEYYTNYQIFWNYLQDYKGGNPNREEYLRMKDFIIKRIYVYGLDNNRNRVVGWELRDNLITGISGIKYSSTGDGKRITFNTMWTTTHVNIMNMRRDKWEIPRENEVLNNMTGHNPSQAQPM